MAVAIGHDAHVPRPIEIMTPEAYCEARAAKSGSSFYYSFRLLPPARRAAITALYAFCREVDDVVDECSEPALAAIKLKWWDEEIDRAYDGRPEHPVGQALADHVRRYDMPRDVLHEIVAGMAMDLTRHRYPDTAALAGYCYHAAGTVGILAAHVFGFEDPATLVYARELGHALQLINIIRDVREDADRGRIYLPQDARLAGRTRDRGTYPPRHGPRNPARHRPGRAADRAGDGRDLPGHARRDRARRLPRARAPRAPDPAAQAVDRLERRTARAAPGEAGRLRRVSQGCRRRRRLGRPGRGRHARRRGHAHDVA
jgi:hypothetical protein